MKKEHIEELFLQIDKDLIQYIDANDNGQTTKIDTDYKFAFHFYENHLAHILKIQN